MRLVRHIDHRRRVATVESKMDLNKEKYGKK